jgi:hypothetical protein
MMKKPNGTQQGWKGVGFKMPEAPPRTVAGRSWWVGAPRDDWRRRVEREVQRMELGQHGKDRRTE